MGLEPRPAAGLIPIPIPIPILVSVPVWAGAVMGGPVPSAVQGGPFLPPIPAPVPVDIPTAIPIPVWMGATPVPVAAVPPLAVSAAGSGFPGAETKRHGSTGMGSVVTALPGTRPSTGCPGVFECFGAAIAPSSAFRRLIVSSGN